MHGDLTLAQLALVAVTALGAQIIGGLAGYGTGLLMPLVLVPMIGAQAVVPVIGLSAIITNATRVAAFRDSLDLRKVVIVTLAAVPFAAFSAWGYTLLTGKGAAILIGVMLIVLVPARRFFEHLKMRLSERGLAISSVGYGLVMGGTSGSGVMLLSMLMASGLTGTQVIATDAAISFLLGLSLGCGNPLSMILIYGSSPQGRTGEALGLRMSLNKIIQIGVPLLFGYLGSMLGLIAVFWSNGLLLLGAARMGRRVVATAAPPHQEKPGASRAD